MIFRRLPIFPTLLVLAAVAVMIALGFWQIDRLHQKEALLERYRAAPALSADAPFPRDAATAQIVLYRHATVACPAPTGVSAMSGQSATGEPGWAHIALCALPGGGSAKIVLGWSRNSADAIWPGGTVQGIIAPGPRLVADPPLAGLAANARPDPANIPNNHLAYAVQWFLFAAVALVIYAIAVSKRLADPARRR